MPIPQHFQETGLKRKNKTAAFSQKRSKVQHNSLENLPWKTVSRPVETGLGGDDGILDLEEVDDVEVVYEQTDAGRVVKFNVLAAHPNKEEQTRESEKGMIGVGSHGALVTEHEDQDTLQLFDSQTLLPEWHSYRLHPRLLRSLHAKQYLSPTPIQSKALPAAMANRDVVGVAETGSGKTLAYGLPILHHILSEARPSKDTKRRVRALILAPTRELALQVSSHLNMCLHTSEAAVKAEPADVAISKAIKGKGKEKQLENREGTDSTSLAPKKPPRVSIAAIVGGMSTQKQHRILERGIDILVATPGRLWDILEDDDDLAKQIKSLKFLVLDEADRMIEAGHFAELEHILRLTLRGSREDQIAPEFNDNSDVEDDEAENKDDMQTFVFSATLSKDLQRNVKKRTRPKGAWNKKDKLPSTLDDLLLRLDFRDPEPVVIDISPEGGVVSSLKESKIECLSSEKDVYLYYFLLRYPGRSLVFLSSIDGIRRLMPLTELLGLKTFPLHSQLEQRQRLKNLDRFKTMPNSVLLATDIAARGLDIPAVDHVIHYQIPRTTDTYVHRNGRTARAMRRGFSMLMCAPDERRVVRTLLGSLGRQDTDIPEMSIELNLLDKLKIRVQLARKIDSAQHRIKKNNHERNWMKEAAEAMEIELDSDFMSGSEDEQDRPTKHKAKSQSAKTSALKAELKHLLSQPLIAKGVSTRYITSGSRPIVDDLIAGEYHEEMLGMKKVEAGSDLVHQMTKNPKTREKLEEEEWGGFGS